MNKNRRLFIIGIFISLIFVFFINVLATEEEDDIIASRFLDGYINQMTVPIASQLMDNEQYKDAISEYASDYAYKRIMYELDRANHVPDAFYDRINNYESQNVIHFSVSISQNFSNIAIVTFGNDNGDLANKSIHLNFVSASDQEITNAYNFSKTIKNRYQTFDIEDYVEAGCFEDDPVWCSGIAFDINDHVTSEIYDLEQLTIRVGGAGRTSYYIYIVKDGVVIGIKPKVEMSIVDTLYIPSTTADTITAYEEAGNNYFSSIIPSEYEYTFNVQENDQELYRLTINISEVYIANITYKVIKQSDGIETIVNNINSIIDNIESYKIVNYYNGKNIIDWPDNISEFSSQTLVEKFNINDYNYPNIRLEVEDARTIKIFGFIGEGDNKTIVTQPKYIDIVPQKEGDNVKLNEINTMLESINGGQISRTELYNALSINETEEETYSSLALSKLNSSLNALISGTNVTYDVVEGTTVCNDENGLDCTTNYIVMMKNNNIFYGTKKVTYFTSNKIYLPYDTGPNTQDVIDAIKTKVASDTGLSPSLITVEHIIEEDLFDVSFNNHTYRVVCMLLTPTIYFEQEKLVISVEDFSENNNLENYLKVKNISISELNLTWTSNAINYVNFNDPSSGVMSYEDINNYTYITVTDNTYSLEATIEVMIASENRARLEEVLLSLGSTMSVPCSDSSIDDYQNIRVFLKYYVASLLPEDIILKSFSFDSSDNEISVQLGMENTLDTVSGRISLTYVTAIESVESYIADLSYKIRTSGYYTKIGDYYNLTIADNVNENTVYNTIVDELEQYINTNNIRVEKQYDTLGVEDSTGATIYYYYLHIYYNDIYYETSRVKVWLDNSIQISTDTPSNEYVYAATEQAQISFNNQNVLVTYDKTLDKYYLEVEDDAAVEVKVTANTVILIKNITTNDSDPITMNIGDHHTFNMSFFPIYKNTWFTFTCYSDHDEYSLSSDCKSVTALSAGNNLPVKICLNNDTNVCITYHLTITGLPDINFALTSYTLTGSVIHKIALNTSVTSLITNLGNLSTVVIKDGDDNYTTGNIKTGLTLTYKDITYTLSVKGDVRGTGTVRMADVMKVANYLLDDTVITGDAYKKAADVTSDGNVRMNDVMKIANYLVDGGNL